MLKYNEESTAFLDVKIDKKTPLSLLRSKSNKKSAAFLVLKVQQKKRFISSY